MNYATLDEVRAANQAAGGDFFALENTRYFRRHFDTGVIAGQYFIASELRRRAIGDRRQPQRRWTVYRASRDGVVEIMGNFQQHSTLGAAKSYLKHELGVDLTSV